MTIVLSGSATPEPAPPPTTADLLVASARAMLDEQGLEGLTLRAIARRAGVSHGAPLRHFPTLARAARRCRGAGVP